MIRWSLGFGPTPDRVRHHTGINWWPRGLQWFYLGRRRSRLTGQKTPMASYTIKSRGRTGAKARQRLMVRQPFVVAVDRWMNP